MNFTFANWLKKISFNFQVIWKLFENPKFLKKYTFISEKGQTVHRGGGIDWQMKKRQTDKNIVRQSKYIDN